MNCQIFVWLFKCSVSCLYHTHQQFCFNMLIPWYTYVWAAIVVETCLYLKVNIEPDLFILIFLLKCLAHLVLIATREQWYPNKNLDIHYLLRIFFDTNMKYAFAFFFFHLMFIFVQSMELTGEALEFLKGVFSMFDIDNVWAF